MLSILKHASQIFLLVLIIQATLVVASLLSVPTSASTLKGQVFQLRIFLDGRWLAEGAAVRALIDGQDCTQQAYSVRPPSDGPDTPPRYSVTVFSDADRAGCGVRNKSIVWLVNGRTAAEATAWPELDARRPFAQHYIDVFVGPQPMALDGLVFRASGLSQGPPVEAFIDGQLCASGVFEPASYQLGGGDSYSALVIPPAEVVPACGYPGASVEIRVDGRPIEGRSVTWRPGARQHDIILLPATTTEDSVAKSDPQNWRPFAAGVISGVGATVLIIAIAQSISRRRTRPNRTL